MKEEKPIQKRAIETRNKILNAAFVMYGKQGYYQTTVDEIAAQAGVSTGIAYRYFRNKKHLLLSTLEHLIENIRSLSETEDFSAESFTNAEALSEIIEKFEQLHLKYYSFHEELEGLRHTDKDVKELYDNFENTAMNALVVEMKNLEIANLRERLHMVVSIIESFCHTVADSRYDKLDRDFLKTQTIKTVIYILNNDI